MRHIPRSHPSHRRGEKRRRATQNRRSSLPLERGGIRLCIVEPTMDYQYFLLDISDKVATVTINRPDKGNALSPAVLEEVITIFNGLAARDDVNVIVFTGGERFFSAGFDLNEIRKLEKVTNETYTALFHRAYRAVLFCPQPVIAAVGGAAIAGGFDLTMMCDIRYASSRAKFGQREVVLSLTPILDPLWRIIGLGRAKEVALSGRIYDAAEAERMGYVSKVFAEGELLASVRAIAVEMAGYDRMCLAETKQLSNQLLNLDLDGAMRAQEWLFRTYIGSEENHQRIDALQARLAAERRK
ncbi:enoyl-CoA hydratase/isomerase family protein [Cupriavidus sp. IDO]|uniref:enoyl-CoA hydratase/isomerase family protein n=1 Tax=Cupriavidus sp. IDO TaxID=1539142 RepID=UPI001EE74C68|nr:enoyl-CoA hydratase/isomerase family protein [Cupriavidus sp. IDO]